MNEYSNIASPDYGLDPKAEAKRQRHIIVIFAMLLVSVILGVFIFNLLNAGEVSLASSYVREHYGDGYEYATSKAVYKVGNCVMSPKESVTVIFHGKDFSVISVVVKDGKVVEKVG